MRKRIIEGRIRSLERQIQGVLIVPATRDLRTLRGMFKNRRPRAPTIVEIKKTIGEPLSIGTGSPLGVDRETADKLCEGSVTPLLTRMVQAKDLSAAQIAELRLLIDQLEEEGSISNS
jgi:hypothetical protein